MLTTPWFNFAVALGIGLLIGLERERSKGEGPTRRPAGIRTFALFAAKTPMHGFVRRTLTTAEVTDGLVFAVATLLIWPQLPDRYLGPLQSLNPHSIWLLVILVLALGASGHIATRVLGARFGLPIAGLASGFVSSTATIGAMAGRAAKDPASMSAGVAGQLSRPSRRSSSWPCCS